MGSWVSVAMMASLVLLGGPALFIFFPGLVGADEAHVLLTGSMAPHLRSGDVVFLDSFDSNSDQARIGDLIAYRTKEPQGVLVLHRIVLVRTEHGQIFYETKGDANPTPDPNLVEKKSVVGTYAFHLPYYGIFLLFARTPTGILLFVVMPALVSIGIELMRLRRLRRKSNPRERPVVLGRPIPRAPCQSSRLPVQPSPRRKSLPEPVPGYPIRYIPRPTAPTTHGIVAGRTKRRTP